MNSLLKNQFALDTGVKVILCIGETLEERKVVSLWMFVPDNWMLFPRLFLIGQTLLLLRTCLGNWYWFSRYPEDAEETHKGIRAHLAKTIGAEQAEKPESCTVVQSTVRTLRISKTKQMLMVS